MPETDLTTQSRSKTKQQNPTNPQAKTFPIPQISNPTTKFQHRCIQNYVCIGVELTANGLTSSSSKGLESQRLIVWRSELGEASAMRSESGKLGSLGGLLRKKSDSKGNRWNVRILALECVFVSQENNKEKEGPKSIWRV